MSSNSSTGLNHHLLTFSIMSLYKYLCCADGNSTLLVDEVNTIKSSLVYVGVCVYLFACVYLCVCVYTFLCKYICASMCKCVHAYQCVCIYVSISLHMCVYARVCDEYMNTSLCRPSVNLRCLPLSFAQLLRHSLSCKLELTLTDLSTLPGHHASGIHLSLPYHHFLV